MRITSNKVFPAMMLVLGLASISMPVQVAYSAPQTTTDTTSDGFNRTKTYDSATGEHKQTESKTDPATGVTTTRNVSWKDGQSQPVHYTNTTITYPDGAYRVENYDAQTGKLTAKTDHNDRGGSTWNYNPQTGGLTSRVTWSASDPGGVSTISYDGKSSSCKDVGDQGCMGHVTKTDITDGKTGQEYIRTFDQKGNVTSDQVRDKVGNVTDIKSVGAGTSATTRDSNGKVIAQKDTYPDGTSNSRTYSPDGKVKSVEMYDPASKQTKVSDYNSDGSVGSLSVKDSTGKLISKTDKGPNKYEKTTTYDPKTGFMTSKSETQADGSIQKINYTGNCSQFGGSDCRKTSEFTTDSKTGKITAAKLCDKQGECKSVDPSKLVSAGGGPPFIPPTEAAGKRPDRRQQAQGAGAAVPPAGDPKGQPPLQPPTKNPDGSTTAVTKNPDGSKEVTQRGPDGKTLGVQTFDASGKQTSATAFGQDGKKTMTRTFGADGGSISTKFDSAGRPSSVDTVDANGKLTSVKCDVPAVCAGALNQQQKQLTGVPASPTAQRLPPARPNGKQNIKADVAKQIEGKSSENREALRKQTHVKDGTARIGKSADLKQGKQDIKADVAKQIGDKPHVDVAGNKEKLKAGIEDRLENRGQAVQLNPPDKAGRKMHLDNKINIGSHKSNSKEGFAKGEIPPGSKINGKVVPPSQSPSHVLQDVKHQPKINAVEKLKTKSKSQNWGSASGSQGAAKHYPLEKQR